MKISLKEAELTERLRWYINIRWLTAGAVGLAGLVARWLRVDVPLTTIILIALFIALYNVAFQLYLKRIKSRRLVSIDLPQKAERFVLLQAVVDIITLTVLIHYTGGLENPFIFYFIFHTVLTGIFLPPATAYMQAAFVSVAVGAMAIGEYLSIIPHHHLKGFIPEELYDTPIYLATVYGAFATAILFTTYIVSSISERLKAGELELAEKTKRLKELNRQLEQKDRLKSEYVRMVAHDVKGPLSSILTMVDVLTDEYLKNLPQDALQITAGIRRKAEFLHGYVAELLDISEIRLKKTLRLEPVELSALVEDVLMLTGGGEKGLQIEVTIIPQGLTLVADREQLFCVLKNLIENAVNYTPEGGRITISATAEDGAVRIDVSDTGIGIPPDEIGRIFDEFYRATNAEKLTRGTGLGLSLVKLIVERHGGSISVESTPGMGTTFSLRLPLRHESDKE